MVAVFSAVLQAQVTLPGLPPALSQNNLSWERKLNKKTTRAFIYCLFSGIYKYVCPCRIFKADLYGAIQDPDVQILSIATRPDCLPEDILQLLEEINQIKPVWVELGLQTIHPQTATYIRRGYPLEVFEEAVNNLRRRNISVITHTILGLPGENEDMMLETIDYLNKMDIQGIKLQLLHNIKRNRSCPRL